MKAERFNVNGIHNLGTICTSHVERCNLTIRTFMRRFTRLALGFSKKVENLAAATAIHVAVYNFCRIHSTIRCTPAMAAGVIDRLWSMDDLYEAVTKHGPEGPSGSGGTPTLQRLRNSGKRSAARVGRLAYFKIPHYPPGPKKSQIPSVLFNRCDWPMTAKGLGFRRGADWVKRVVGVRVGRLWIHLTFFGI